MRVICPQQGYLNPDINLPYTVSKHKLMQGTMQPTRLHNFKSVSTFSALNGHRFFQALYTKSSKVCYMLVYLACIFHHTLLYQTTVRILNINPFPPPHLLIKVNKDIPPSPNGSPISIQSCKPEYPPVPMYESNRETPIAKESSHVPSLYESNIKFSESWLLYPTIIHVPGCPKFHESTTALSFPKMHVNPMGKSCPESWNSWNPLQVV